MNDERTDKTEDQTKQEVERKLEDVNAPSKEN